MTRRELCSRNFDAGIAPTSVLMPGRCQHIASELLGCALKVGGKGPKKQIPAEELPKLKSAAAPALKQTRLS